MTTRRLSDRYLLLLSVFIVLAVGGLLAAGIWIASRGGSGPVECGLVEVGTADDVRARIAEAGPEYASAGRRCDYWLALDAGDVVAYRTMLTGRDCTVRYAGGSFHCGDEELDPADLEQYPLAIHDAGGVDVLVLDLRTPATTT